MKPPAFAYHRPTDLAGALHGLATLEDAKILAGGQSLMPMMNFRFVMPQHVIDINRIPELAEMRVEGDNLHLGAMVRQRDAELSPVIRERCPLLWEALGNVGHMQTRNRGTIGGSLSHLDPAAEIPAVCSALDATLHIASSRGRRDLPIRDWTVAYMTPNLEPDELLTGVTLPLWPREHGHAFIEVARRHGDFAMAGAAALLTLDGSDRIARAAVALTGVDTGPVRLAEAEAMLAGAAPDDALFRRAAETASSVAGIEDVHASADYRRRIAVVLTWRTFQIARP